MLALLMRSMLIGSVLAGGWAGTGITVGQHVEASMGMPNDHSM